MPFSAVLTPEKAFSIVSKSAGTLTLPGARVHLVQKLSSTSRTPISPAQGLPVNVSGKEIH